MDRIKREKKDSGITLISLIVTVLILAIIAGVGISSGIQTTDSIKFKKFNDELQIIQARVDVIYEQIQAEEKLVENLGGDTYPNSKDIMDRTFEALNDASIDRGAYRYYTKQSLNIYLGIEDVTQSVLINWSTRDVISAQGIKIDGVRYYRYEGAYKPSYVKNSYKKIELTLTRQSEGDIKKVTAKVVTADDNSPVSNFTLKYKLESEDTWRIADGNYFETAITGRYLIEVSGEGIESEITEIILEE